MTSSNIGHTSEPKGLSFLSTNSFSAINVNELKKNLKKGLALQDQVTEFAKNILNYSESESELKQNLESMQVGLAECLKILEVLKKPKETNYQDIRQINEELDQILNKLKATEALMQNVDEGGIHQRGKELAQIKQELNDIIEKKQKISQNIAEKSTRLKNKITHSEKYPRPSPETEQGTILRLRNFMDKNLFLQVTEKEVNKEKKRISDYKELKETWNQAEVKQFEAALLLDKLKIALSIIPELTTWANTLEKHCQEILKYKNSFNSLDIISFSKDFIPETENRNLNVFYGIIQNSQIIFEDFSKFKETVEGLKDSKKALISKVSRALKQLKESFSIEYADGINGPIAFIESDNQIESKLAQLRNDDINSRKNLAKKQIEKWNSMNLKFEELKKNLKIISAFKDSREKYCEIYLEFEYMAGILRTTRKKEISRDKHQEEFVRQLKKFQELSQIVESSISTIDVESSTSTIDDEAFTTIIESSTSTTDDEAFTLIESNTKSEDKFFWLDDKSKTEIEAAINEQKISFIKEEKKNEELTAQAYKTILPTICDIAVEELNFIQSTLKATLNEKGQVSSDCPQDFSQAYSTKIVFRNKEKIGEFTTNFVKKTLSLVELTGIPVKANIILETPIQSPFHKAPSARN